MAIRVAEVVGLDRLVGRNMAIRVAEVVGLMVRVLASYPFETLTPLAVTFALTVRWFAGRVAAYSASSG